MNSRIVVFFAALLVFVAAAYLLMKPAGPADVASQVRAASSDGAWAVPGSFSAAAPVRAQPPRPHVMAHAPAQDQRRSLYDEYVHSKSYRALYERLRASSEGNTAEGKYVMYDILRQCANVTDRPYRRGAQKPLDQRRQEFLAALATNDPQRDKRLAAFDSATVNRCAGFGDVTVSQADLDKLLAGAAGLGDPKAKAATVEQEIWQARRAGQWRTVSLSDTQIATLEDAIGSRDPEAMVLAGRLLSNSWHEMTVRIGPDAQAIEPRAFYNAWQVLACEYGYPCGSDSSRLLEECAYNGHCDAQSLPDYLYFYASSPHESQLVAQYESILRGAIENGDWSQLGVTRGTTLPGNRFMFGHGPG